MAFFVLNAKGNAADSSAWFAEHAQAGEDPPPSRFPILLDTFAVDAESRLCTQAYRVTLVDPNGIIRFQQYADLMQPADRQTVRNTIDALLAEFPTAWRWQER